MVQQIFDSMELMHLFVPKISSNISILLLNWSNDSMNFDYLGKIELESDFLSDVENEMFERMLLVMFEEVFHHHDFDEHESGIENSHYDNHA